MRANRFVVPALVLAIAAPLAVFAQSDEFQFVLSVTDKQGRPVIDLRRDEVLMSENGVENEIVRIQPHRVPVTVTIAVDNGPLSRDILSHYRAGLEGLVNALPEAVEVTVITTAPQPWMVVRPTTDRDRILRGVNGFAPEAESPRFTDALVEFSQRERKTLQETRRLSSLPVLVMISTAASEATSYEVPEIDRAIKFLQARKARVYVAMLMTRQEGQGFAPLNTARQTLIAIPVTEATRGRYEALAISNRLTTLLPEIGQEIAALHDRHYNQVLITARRYDGRPGPLTKPRFEVKRPGLTGQVSLDGLP
jgi:hypothetical protein